MGARSEVEMDRVEMERRLEQVAAYQASGQKAMAWSQANGVPWRMLASWCAHAERWRAQLDGKALPRRVKRSAAAPMQLASRDFVAASPPMLGAAPMVRVLLPSAGHAEVHWPLSHTAELAAWLREVAR
jgi:hypothetical protein